MEYKEKELLERAIKAEVRLSEKLRLLEKEDNKVCWPHVINSIVWVVFWGYVVTVIFG